MESFPQPVDDYFVEPPQAEEEEEEEEERAPPPSSHTPVMVSRGEAGSSAPSSARVVWVFVGGGVGVPLGVT